jgi:hypothetical protein
MTFPQVLKSVWTMENSGINVVGEHLGYDWNQVCDEISKAGFYAEDGDGAFAVYRSSKNDYSSNQIINHIMTELFAAHPDVREIQITN